ncbi:MAG: VWA domain-containing protein [Verrucomicrobia bacterium]|nr:VWA domain-containing protein [Verrucomicrobiota bacterium]
MNIVRHLIGKRRGKAGQTLVMYAILAIVLFLVIGMCIDGATIYLSKAALDKAVDAAALTAVRNLFQGETRATAVAQASLTANYRGGGWNAQDPVVNITYTLDSNDNKVVNILGTAVVNTYFMRIVPRFQTFSISSAANATRAKLIMSLVLDRSGSMAGNNGSAKLPGAVATFISFFDDNMDKVSLVSFASTTNLNVAVQQPFKTLVTTAANSLVYSGGTYSEGGLKLAKQQNDSVIIPAGENYLKVVVFFTDGLANTFQGTWPTNKTYNVGGTDSGTSYAIFNPGTGNQLPNSSTMFSGPSPSYCPTMSTFVSTNGTTKTCNATNFRTEGQLRSLGTANEMRNANMIVFAIGLGGGSVDQSFLHQIANDTSSSTFDPNQPIGEAVFASTANDLQTTFQQIASKILLRLTR